MTKQHDSVKLSSPCRGEASRSRVNSHLSSLLSHTSSLLPHTSSLLPHTSSLLPPTSYLKFNKRFTLIELLVVISVIAILAGMLLPALGQAKGVAKRAQCMNNLKTVGMVTRLYQDDNADYLIPVYLRSDWAAPRFASGDVYRTPQVAAELYPEAVGMREMPTGHLKNHNFIGSAFECPQDNPKNYIYDNTLAFGSFRSSYGFNTMITPQLNSPDIDNTSASAHPRAWKMPSRTVLGTDKCQKDPPIYLAGNRDQPESANCVVGYWHQKGANVLFLDLHVAHMIPSYTSPTGWHGVSFNASTIARQ